MEKEIGFEMAASSIRFGSGVTTEIGMDMKDLGARKVMVCTDPNIAKLPMIKTLIASLDDEDVPYVLYDRVRVEPTDTSFKEAIAFAVDNDVDAFIAFGGGSVIDTAKAANLYSTYPTDDFLAYVNAPIGKGKPVPGPLKPLYAIPTTAGTGSETTGVAIFDLEEMHAKTGIANRALKPTLGIVDPLNMISMPPMITTSTALDILTHAVESYTAIHYTNRPRPERPMLRPAYQGSNPISDMWAIKAMEIMADNFVTAVEDPTNLDARGMMALAATFAGVGFGNAGVTLPHGMSYPVSGMVREYIAPDYISDHPIIPHGISVAINAPSVFRFTGPSNPKRHMEAAVALGADTIGVREEEAGELLADTMIGYFKRFNVPNGLKDVGFTEADIPKLVAGTLPQHRVTKLSPRPAGPEELAELFRGAMRYW
ncbi:hydroxyacid-oxoacid transhydrogenase [Desulfofustis glycolicus]|uniref:hydroxyacid-oxoacid transhydrogenase n=1 Tax=Desulfofustis glycolicus DSM 9705 TaxID=1121409 RepID=A0A1M5X5X4_9BACT|nr:hydroxyacid-oxoacid transhydrogenase [Desulfofustis glycolicus]MCB2216080.1 iron-containing alcohol dehydrogenase [Desulfobulbaceae bacterium]SHH94968.1 hydroxyacid-oxoacid transhydrogenase [Desulfofustis glycolicus DSM 9705]